MRVSVGVISILILLFPSLKYAQDMAGIRLKKLLDHVILRRKLLLFMFKTQCRYQLPLVGGLMAR